MPPVTLSLAVLDGRKLGPVPHPAALSSQAAAQLRSSTFLFERRCAA